MKSTFIGCSIICACILLVVVLITTDIVCNFAGQAVGVAQKEFAPAELLRKYEWFKDAAAQCDAKLASIQAYDKREKDLVKSYEGTKRSEWARSDKEQWNLWESEKAGVKASYNSLAAEYNAAMSKFNYRFTNVGDLPAGTTAALPREFKPYTED